MSKHHQIFNSLVSKKVLDQACVYLYRGVMGLKFFDHNEREYLLINKEKVVKELVQELRSQEGYKPRYAYAYFPPKNELCNRRMLCLHPKDHILRTAFVIELSRMMEEDLLDSCYANRRARGDYSSTNLLVDFGTESWPNFCDWQKKCAEKYKVMLRSDIATFYDSVSHQYFIDRIVKLTGFPDDCEFINLLRKTLEIPIISYSHSENSNNGLHYNILKQGLVIGSITDGYFANLYLHPVDLMMKRKRFEYGRYNDDMRIFGNTREEVISALQMIQEKLMEIGLNLNSSKTSIHEDTESIKIMIRQFQKHDYLEEEDNEESEDTLSKNIDKNFDNIDFEYKGEINGNNCKEFCQWLNNDHVPYEEWKTVFINDLIKIMTNFRESSKFAAWLLVKAMIGDNIPIKIKNHAGTEIAKYLTQKQVCQYSHYRILHHLLHPARRKKCMNILYNYLTKKELKNIFIENLSRKSFELNIISLYGLIFLVNSKCDLKRFVKGHIKGKIPEPLIRCLGYHKENLSANLLPKIHLTEHEEFDSYVEAY
jgi:hypothetical protein